MLFLKTHDYFLPGKLSVQVISGLCLLTRLISNSHSDAAWFSVHLQDYNYRWGLICCLASKTNPLVATGNGRMVGSVTHGDASQAAWLMVDLAELRWSLGVEVWDWHCFLQRKMWNVIISEANKASSTRNKQTKK